MSASLTRSERSGAVVIGTILLSVAVTLVFGWRAGVATMCAIWAVICLSAVFLDVTQNGEPKP